MCANAIQRSIGKTCLMTGYDNYESPEIKMVKKPQYCCAYSMCEHCASRCEFYDTEYDL